MLGKLTKYELRATMRVFLPLYLAILVTAAFCRVFVHFDFDMSNEILAALSRIVAFAYGAVLFATFALTLVLLVQRFYKNLLGSEGYLMHTLPVKTWQNISAKLIAVVVWIIATMLVVGVSVLMIVGDLALIRHFIESLPEAMRLLFGDDQIWLYLLEGMFALLTQGIANILLIYVSLAIGHLFHKHRVAAAVGAYLVIIFVLGVLLNLAIAGFNLMPWRFWGMFSGESLIHLVLLGGSALNLLFGAACFFTTNYILSRHLNLQ